MISPENHPIHFSTFDEDFTEVKYRQLLRVAVTSYRFVKYDKIPWGTRFILWRHDLDYSINRAVALARIEAEERITATYFVNPHSEYYNPFEPEQAKLVKHILSLGHRLGLHFDAAFHEILSEEQLHGKVAQEARWLEDVFGVRPDAFSFHNPVINHLQCDADRYGGLVNCYSQRLKTEVPYCSDSNGYWRFRRLHDVLTEATDHCLQVLTHPGWWQEHPLPPRQRIFRCAYGRAAATMRAYDEGLRNHGRLNHRGKNERLVFLRPLHSRLFALFDYLWNQDHLAALFVELWRLHECQVNRICKAVFLKDWQVTAAEVNDFFEDRPLTIDGWRLFKAVFGTTMQEAAGIEEGVYREQVNLRNSLVHGRSSAPREQLETGCIVLSGAIEAIATWGKSQPIDYDGIRHLDSVGIPTCKTSEDSIIERLEEVAGEVANNPQIQWERFRAEIQQSENGKTHE